MKINDKDALIQKVLPPILNNTPVSELLRVYSLALAQELSSIDDEQLAQSLTNAGLGEILEEHLED